MSEETAISFGLWTLNALLAFMFIVGFLLILHDLLAWIRRRSEWRSRSGRTRSERSSW